MVCDPAIAPRLRWVQLDTSGVDHLRSEPVWDSSVPITTIGGVSPVPLAEYVVWAILGCAHRMPELLAVHTSRQWPTARERWERLMPVAVRGATVGVVGYGRIGREIGRLAMALGMRVIGMSRTGGTHALPAQDYLDVPVGESLPPADDRLEVVGPGRLHELLRRSDYLVVVVPLTDLTRGMIGVEALAELKTGAVVVNVSRGGVVDEAALHEALADGRVRAAVLDVFGAEPLPADHLWWDEPRVLVTPHVSGLAPGYSEQVLRLVTENLRRLAQGRTLINVVDRTHGY